MSVTDDESALKTGPEVFPDADDADNVTVSDGADTEPENYGICPECGSHDVSQVSRVTGYLADVAGWNQGKQQELKDRARYNVA